MTSCQGRRVKCAGAENSFILRCVSREISKVQLLASKLNPFQQILSTSLMAILPRFATYGCMICQAKFTCAIDVCVSDVNLFSTLNIAMAHMPVEALILEELRQWQYPLPLRQGRPALGPITNQKTSSRPTLTFSRSPKRNCSIRPIKTKLEDG